MKKKRRNGKRRSGKMNDVSNLSVGENKRFRLKRRKRKRQREK